MRSPRLVAQQPFNALVGKAFHQVFRSVKQCAALRQIQIWTRPARRLTAVNDAIVTLAEADGP
jgi:hypothetical protein